MRKFTVAVFALILSYSISAQSLSGEYFITGQGGTINLALQQNGNAVQGTLTDMQGTVYQAQAEVEDGEAFGTLSTPQGSMYFEAFREDNELYLTLIPVGATGQPDPSGAQEFIMQAKGPAVNSGTPPPITAMPQNNPAPTPPGGSLGGPLGGQTGHSTTQWDGNYTGNVMGTAATLQMQAQGGQLSGIVDVSGYRYQLQGNISGNQSEGKLVDPQTQGYFNCTANLNGDQLTLVLQNPANGQSQQVLFQRGGAGNATAMPGSNSGNPGGSQQVAGDSRIVGAWTYTDSYTSGEYSFATQWKLIVNPDGSYIYGDGRVVGGGPGISGDSGSGGDVTRGKWKTENSIIHINTGGGWQPYARYTTDGQSLLMQFGDGSKQLWKRSY